MITNIKTLKHSNIYTSYRVTQKCLHTKPNYHNNKHTIINKYSLTYLCCATLGTMSLSCLNPNVINNIYEQPMTNVPHIAIYMGLGSMICSMLNEDESPYRIYSILFFGSISSIIGIRYWYDEYYIPTSS